ncbi:MAG: Na/Pi cotransporter family protein [Oligosphaeraceae bacterium]
MIIPLLHVFGGLAIFMYGMKLMSDGLHHSAGDRMRSILKVFSANRFVAILSGAVVTSVIQSSSASTVMVIGFVNAGLLTLVQSIGIIFGANIGTTITAQLVAFNIQWLVMPALFLGMVLWLQKKRSLSFWGLTIMGFGFLFLGLNMMSGELKGLSKLPSFMNAFQYFSCPPENGFIPPGAALGAIAVGMAATFVIQSSSAASGVIIILASNGMIDLHTAVALVMGSNIGTTITAQLAAIPANRVAKQAALAHTLFNLIGVALTFASFYIVIHGEPLFFLCLEKLCGGAPLPRQIANAHTLFNLATTLILIPFIPMLARLCEAILPAKADEIQYRRLEPHLLQNPAIALTQTTAALRSMLKNACAMADAALRIYGHNDEQNRKILRQLSEREEDVDHRQADIAEYLAQMMQKELTPAQAEMVPLLLHCSNDAERIGDHASRIQDIMHHIQDKGIRFSDAAAREYDLLLQEWEEHVQRVVSLLEDNRPEKIQLAIMARSRLHEHFTASEQEHMARIAKGTCHPEVGMAFLELLTEMRKLLRHLSNITDRAGQFYVRPIPASPLPGDVTRELSPA